jgi:hypothetical protein
VRVARGRRDNDMAELDEAPAQGAPGVSLYSPQIGKAICARVAAGLSLRRVARQEGMPHRTTIRNWAAAHPEFAEALMAAMRTARLAKRRGDRELAVIRAARPKPVKGGSASTYTPEIGASICLRLANGESLISIGRDPEMPCAATVYNWIKRHPEFEDMYVQARQMQADYLFDEAREVGKGATPKTVWVARLQFDIIRWQTARLAPRKYCERLIVAEPVEKPFTVVIRKFTPEGESWTEPPQAYDP